MTKYKIGYTQGVYDMFHIGHLNLINHAKEKCDFLVVGVNSDELVQKYKNKKTIIPENERVAIVNNIKAVDKAIIVNTLDKLEIKKQIDFDIVFIGSDWKGSERWIKTEEELSKVGCRVEYIPHTDGISSTLLTEVLHKLNEDK